MGHEGIAIPRTENPEAPRPVPITVPLPAIETNLSPDGVVAKLRAASKRGRLPGFETDGLSGHSLFRVAAFGQPFDRDLIALAEPRQSERTHLTFTTRLRPKMPLLAAAVLVSTVWPGVWFTDQLIPGEWGWIPTWWWYLPLTALPLPWIWRGVMRKSEAAAHDSAHRAVRDIAREVGGAILS